MLALFFFAFLLISTLGARDFSGAVSGFCQVLTVNRAKFPPPLAIVASAYGRRCVGL